MKAIITVGISASGKSTWAEEFVTKHQGWTNINRDDIRFDRFCNGERNWEKYKFSRGRESKVTEIQNKLIRGCFEGKMNIIVSDTNLHKSYRETLIEKLMGWGYDVEIKEFPISLEEAIKRDKLRPNSVGEDVIYKQYLQWLEYKGEKKYEPDVTLQPCVVVDVDGTVAKMNNRGPFDWDKVDQDLPISVVMDIVDGLYDRGYHVAFLSGRDGSCYEKTYQWLKRYFQFDIELYMRPEGDSRKDYIIKRELFDKHLRNEYNVKMVIDDRRQVIQQCWEPLGIKVINVGKFWENF